MSKINLYGHTNEQLQQVITEIGGKSYNGKQLYKWMYNNRQYDFHMMTDLSLELRQKLADRYLIKGLELDTREKSVDRSEKFLLRLKDNQLIETVMIPEGIRKTICVSSQSGCGLGCTFCATAQLGLIRNLTAGEIIGQLAFLKDIYKSSSFTNLVFMGMGEPLANFQNLISALKILSDPIGMNFAAKRITVSTVGIIPRIRDLTNSGLKVRLALSLHSAFQDKREKLIPTAKAHPLHKLIKVLRYHTQVTNNPVTIEYLLIKGINDSEADAIALGRLLGDLSCKINILSYNPVAALPYKRPSADKVNWFAKILLPLAPAVTVRRSRGGDINAACGQLAGQKMI